MFSPSPVPWNHSVINQSKILFLMYKAIDIVLINRNINIIIITLILGFPEINRVESGNQSGKITKKSDLIYSEIKNLVSQDQSKYRYEGAGKCAAICHNNVEMGFQYDIIRNSKLSKAYEILASGKASKFAHKAHLKENPDESQVCLRCHVTGGGLDSSFFAVTYRKEDGITCEACHKGPYRPRSFIPVESDCLKCHNNSVHRIPEFDFKERCEKIAHPRPVR